MAFESLFKPVLEVEVDPRTRTITAGRHAGKPVSKLAKRREIMESARPGQMFLVTPHAVEVVDALEYPQMPTGARALADDYWLLER